MFYFDLEGIGRQLKRLFHIIIFMGYFYFYGGLFEVFDIKSLFYYKDTYQYASLAYIVFGGLLILLKPIDLGLKTTVLIINGLCITALEAVVLKWDYISFYGLSTSWRFLQNDIYVSTPLVYALMIIIYLVVEMIAEFLRFIKSI